jgi:hypothetical protein
MPITRPTRRKRFSLDEIRELLGHNADERIVAALLRKKVRRVRTVTPEELASALEYADGEGQPNKGRFMRFATVAAKWVLESKKARMNFKTWVVKLQHDAEAAESAENAKQVKGVRRGRKPQS